MSKAKITFVFLLAYFSLVMSTRAAATDNKVASENGTISENAHKQGGVAERSIRLAVEFNSHAACAHIARHKGWFQEEGLEISTYESYMTGMTLAAALARGSIDAAYICLIPAINAYANAGVRLKVVAGTHKYGYGLAVNHKKVKTVEDLENSEIRIGCIREGSPTDALLHKMIEKYNLDERIILKKTMRMSSTEQLLALRTGQLDAAFMAEQYPTMAEGFKFKVLVTAQDLWPAMQGSVLVVTDDLLKNYPEAVRKLVNVTKRATQWLTEHPEEASRIVASELSIVVENVFPEKVALLSAKLDITPEVIMTSLTKRITCSIDIEPKEIQNSIDYSAALGNIKKSFNAEELIYLRWLVHE